MDGPDKGPEAAGARADPAEIRESEHRDPRQPSILPIGVPEHNPWARDNLTGQGPELRDRLRVPFPDVKDPGSGTGI
jgi:hypothetical protein